MLKGKQYRFELFVADEDLRLACGLTLQAMSRYSPDVMKRHTAKALPAVFFAMHEKKTTGIVQTWLWYWINIVAVLVHWPVAIVLI